MKKILVVLLVLFVLFDIGLAIVFFSPKGKIAPLLNLLPKNCKVVDSKYCKTVTIVGSGKSNETTVALFSLPRGTRIYAPVDGKLSFQRTADRKDTPDDQVGLPYHLIEGRDGNTYFLVFEPEAAPQSRQIKSGEVIGIATGKKYTYMQNRTLAVSVVKNLMFNRVEFDALFR